METKEFKKTFGEIAKANGFEFAFGVWFKESTEIIIVMNLQKSSYSRFFYLNININIQGIRGTHYVKSKELARDIGDVFRRQPKEFLETTDLESPLDDLTRKIQIIKLFEDFIIPFTNTALTKNGLIELYKRNELNIWPAAQLGLGLIDKLPEV